MQITDRVSWNRAHASATSSTDKATINSPKMRDDDLFHSGPTDCPVWSRSRRIDVHEPAAEHREGSLWAEVDLVGFNQETR